MSMRFASTFIRLQNLTVRKELAMSLDASGGIGAAQAQRKDHMRTGGALIHSRCSNRTLPHGLLQQAGHCIRPAHIQGLRKCDACAPILIMSHLPRSKQMLHWCVLV